MEVRDYYHRVTLFVQVKKLNTFHSGFEAHFYNPLFVAMALPQHAPFQSI